MTGRAAHNGVGGAGHAALRLLIIDADLAGARATAAGLRLDHRISSVVTCPDVATGLGELFAGAVDVVLLDVGVRGTDAVQQIATLQAASPGVRVLAVTGKVDRATLGRVAESGACGCLSKGRPVSDVLDAVTSAPATGMRLERTQIALLTASREAAVPVGSRSVADVTSGLTRRELEVLLLLATGKSAVDISDELFLSVHTSRDHLKSIFKKLGARSQLQAVAIARRRGIV